MSFYRLRTAVFAGAAIAVAAACSLIINDDKSQCNTTAECTSRGSKFTGYICTNDHVCAPEGGCKSNAECIDANNGHPFICNKVTKACVDIQTDLGGDTGTPALCTPHASAAEIRNDDTIWLGAVFDTTGLLGQQLGGSYLNFLELARSEISGRTSGLPAATVGGKGRPLAFIHCETGGDVDASLRAANYLADKAGIQLFIAGESPNTYAPLGTQVFLPKKLMNMGLVAQGAADIPSGPPATLFTMFAGVNVPVITYGIQALEKDARKRIEIPEEQPARLFELVNDNELEKAAYQIGASQYVLNGKNVADNAQAGNYKVRFYKGDLSPAELDAVVADAVAFKPDMVSVWGFAEVGDQIVPKVDAALAAQANGGPQWQILFNNITANLFGAATMNPNLQGRLRWLQQEYDTPEVRAKMLDYQAKFTAAPPIDVGLLGLVAIPYDIFYLYAYAITANGARPVTGENIAASLQKVFADGSKSILTGPNDLFDGFAALGTGGTGTINLRGIEAFRQGPDNIKLDLAKGQHSFWPYSIYCPLSNLVAGGGTTPLVSTYPPFAMISGQYAGVRFGYPDSKPNQLDIDPKCNMWLDFGQDAGVDGGN